MASDMKIPNRLVPRDDGAMDQIGELFGFLTPDSAEFFLCLFDKGADFFTLEVIEKPQPEQASTSLATSQASVCDACLPHFGHGITNEKLSRLGRSGFPLSAMAMPPLIPMSQVYHDE
jgi:hypothetical protein